MTDTKIEWADKTWNPIVGCSLVSPGCMNCYAMRQAQRLKHMLAVGKEAPFENHYFGTTKVVNGNPVWTGHVAQAPDSILLAPPLKWKKPARIFVNSMGDLFHESVPDAWIDRVFAVMALAPQHIFQALTKRSKRMRAYCSDPKTPERVWSAAKRIEQSAISLSSAVAHAINKLAWGGPHLWPLPNVHLGVSAEDQPRADERIPDLLSTPAAVRFVSAEPLLGLIDFAQSMMIWAKNVLKAHIYDGDPMPANDARGSSLHWIIVGGESGKGARPMHPDWARSIRDQCAAANVPFFFKQWGEWIDESEATANGNAPGSRMFDVYGRPNGDGWHFYDPDDRLGGAMVRLGKRRAGRLLDGIEHSAFPFPFSPREKVSPKATDEGSP